VPSEACPAISSFVLTPSRPGFHHVGVTLGASQLDSACVKLGSLMLVRCGNPSRPARVASAARITSGIVIDAGDSCACFASSLRSLPENTRK